MYIKDHLAASKGCWNLQTKEGITMKVFRDQESNNVAKVLSGLAIEAKGSSMKALSEQNFDSYRSLNSNKERIL